MVTDATQLMQRLMTKTIADDDYDFKTLGAFSDTKINVLI